ncbi:MAG: glutamate racemase [Terriglobales bacterium]
MSPLRPTIGVFDSGFGGLTVLKALLELIPAVDYLYFGDTARLPYGSKSAETVARYAVEATNFFQRRGATLIVIACNSATALALDQVKKASNVPVIGVVEPGAERAATATKNKTVAVIATEATVTSHAYLKALQKHGIQSREMACPLLVPLIEEGWVKHDVTRQVVRIYLDRTFAGGFESADVLVLGCTHYPLIRPLLQEATPPHVTIVDSAESTAHAVRDLLRATPLPSAAQSASAGVERRRASRMKFFVTDSVAKFQRMGPFFLEQPIDDIRHVDLET